MHQLDGETDGRTPGDSKDRAYVVKTRDKIKLRGPYITRVQTLKTRIRILNIPDLF